MATVGERAGLATTAGQVGTETEGSKERGRKRTGMEVPRVFSTEGVSPQHSTRWTGTYGRRRSRTSAGRVIFRQTDCEVPRGWSQLATNVVASKNVLLRRGAEHGGTTSGRSEGVRQLINRVTRTITNSGRDNSYFASDEDAERFYDELTTTCASTSSASSTPRSGSTLTFITAPAWSARPNNWRWDEETRSVGEKAASAPTSIPRARPASSRASPRTGTASRVWGPACALATSEAMLFKYGSGTGTDLSTLRSSQERLTGGGRPSGPVSFMRVYDAIASVVKSGGKCLRPQPRRLHGVGRPARSKSWPSPTGTSSFCLSRRLGRVAAKTAQAFRSGRKEVVALITDKGEFHLSADHPVMLKTGEMVPVHGLRI